MRPAAGGRDRDLGVRPERGESRATKSSGANGVSHGREATCVDLRRGAPRIFEPRKHASERTGEARRIVGDDGEAKVRRNAPDRRRR